MLLCCYYRDSSENLSKEAMFVQRFSQCSEACVVRDLAYAFWAFSLSCECKKCSYCNVNTIYVKSGICVIFKILIFFLVF